MPTLSPAALAMLACPACLSTLRELPERISCESCGRVYPIRDNIPILLVDEADTPHGNPS